MKSVLEVHRTIKRSYSGTKQTYHIQMVTVLKALMPDNKAPVYYNRHGFDHHAISPTPPKVKCKIVINDGQAFTRTSRQLFPTSHPPDLINRSIDSELSRNLLTRKMCYSRESVKYGYNNGNLPHNRSIGADRTIHKRMRTYSLSQLLSKPQHDAQCTPLYDPAPQVSYIRDAQTFSSSRFCRSS